MKKITVGLLASAIALSLSSTAIASDEFDHDLRLRLKNEFRDSSQYGYNDNPLSLNKPNETSVWVQGIMLDYKTENLLPYADIEVFAYRNQKLFNKYPNSHRGYLKGVDESYNLFGGALVLNPHDDLEIKIGRWGSDKSHGSFDRAMPILEYSSIRAMPQLREGVLVDYRPENSNFKYFGAVVTKDAGVMTNDWTEIGTVVGLDSDGNAVVKNSNPAFFGGVAYDTKSFGLNSGFRYQDNHSAQGLIEGYYQFPTASGGFFKLDGRTFFAQTIGDEQKRNEDFNNGHDNTWIASAQAMYAKGDFWGSASVGQTGANLFALSLINTDIVYPFDLSLARNRHNTTSFQVGGGYKINNNWSVGLFGIATSGHTTSSEKVEFDGLGGSAMVAYKATDGMFKGFSSTLIMNAAQEDRNGENFDFHDIKWVTQYDFNLL